MPKITEHSIAPGVLDAYLELIRRKGYESEKQGSNQKQDILGINFRTYQKMNNGFPVSREIIGSVVDKLKLKGFGNLTIDSLKNDDAESLLAIAKDTIRIDPVGSKYDGYHIASDKFRDRLQTPYKRRWENSPPEWYLDEKSSFTEEEVDILSKFEDLYKNYPTKQSKILGSKRLMLFM